MLSSIWSLLLAGAEFPNANPGVVDEAEENGKMEFEGVVVDDPKTTGAVVLLAVEVEDAPKANPVDADEELAVEPKIGVGVVLGAAQLVLTALLSEDEALKPNVAPEPKD